MLLVPILVTSFLIFPPLAMAIAAASKGCCSTKIKGHAHPLLLTLSCSPCCLVPAPAFSPFPLQRLRLAARVLLH